MIKDKEKMLNSGYRFITEQKLGDVVAYLFENNNKLKFGDLGIKAKFTNRMTF